MDGVGFEPTTSAHSFLVQPAIDIKPVQLSRSPYLTILGFQMGLRLVVLASHRKQF
jgi:hypothetical protein